MVLSTRNPATGEVIEDLSVASAPEIDEAVQRATAAQQEWGRLDGAARGRVLQRAAALLRERNDELARIEVLDTGKPIAEALVVDVVSGADCIEYFAGAAAILAGEHTSLSSALVYTRREPLGVCVGIGAWNYPLQIACWKSAPALAAGNAMIFKPSELTPLTARSLEEIYLEAGLPAGLFQVLQGDGEVGQRLVTHPGVAKVSLTGEVGTGKRVMADAAASLTQVTLELGGKSPLIVFDDATLDNAVGGALMANFYTQGEVCSNGTRVFVQAAIHDQFVEALVARTEKMQVGDPLDPSTDVGALISAEHADRVVEYIDGAIAQGATCAVGGGRPTNPSLANGNFVEPTVLTGCRDDMTVVCEEVFGPVMSVLSFDSETEVLERANATRFGLAAGVFTNDLTRGHRM
ncbi:UNVERIFIED_CONTAM: hypothetical protein GTU68_037742, partial [Idotea baltica]|nr:hypothetical protein [Idotea baltica]